jgi:putative flippase GtrA
MTTEPGRDYTLVARRHLRLPTWLRFSRYTIGSIICFGVSELVFVALFAPDLLGARGAAIVASIAGIIPGYFLNRSWTWGRRGRSDFWREVVPYWATALISTLIAALGTGLANALFADQPRGIRTIINATAYMVIYGVLFVAKFVIFQRWLFAPAEADAAHSASETPPAAGAIPTESVVAMQPLPGAGPSPAG